MVLLPTIIYFIYALYAFIYIATSNNTEHHIKIIIIYFIVSMVFFTHSVVFADEIVDYLNNLGY